MPSMVPGGLSPRIAQKTTCAQVATTGAQVENEAGRQWPKAEVNSSELAPRVLVVEPSASEATRLRNELIASQIEVYLAGDLINASHALSIFQPNLVLGQLRLPTHGGLELVRRVKQGHATQLTPVILYSDTATVAERIQALEMGATDLLTKPFVSAELVARVWAALRARQTLSIFEQRAHRDSLTGLANRGVFEDHLLREWDNCWRRQTPLSVMITDLDHFKAVNDTLGHAGGDEVLRGAARMLMRSVRSSDLVARYGGEEFAVVAPNCPTAAAVTLAKRFRANLIHHKMAVHDATVGVTASVGIATTDWTQQSQSELLRQADEALYEAKRSGRNAIWVYSPSCGRPTVAIGTGASSD